MSNAFATVEDIQTLWRPLTSEEQSRAEALLPLVSDEIRVAGKSVGKDVDQMIAEDSAYESVVKVVTVDVVTRILRQSTEGDAMTQESQSALGYSWSGTYAVAGGGIANSLLNNDLKKLGLLRQKMGAMFIWQGLKAPQ
jgi:Phage protein Gp19/Gp15/Gp42.